MYISRIKNINTLNTLKDIQNNSCGIKSKNNPSSVSSPNYAKLPASSIKANFMPSFGFYKKISNAVIYDRETGNAVNAAIKREEFGNYYSYKMFVNGKEAGYMDVDFDAIIPEDDYAAIVNDNQCPEITHLRSIMGDKYAGIGTQLVKAAVKESYNKGQNGCLWLKTETGYAYTLSNYRCNENPIPFYYKCGFRSINPKTDEYIKKCLENSEYRKLPDNQILILDSDAAQALKS